MQRWLTLTSNHDTTLYRHSRHVGELTAVFAATLGYSPYDQRLLVQAALLHDIGKTYISLRLLTKPEGLSAKEVQEMRLHPEIGYTALVTEGGHDKHMLEVVRHHHERLNGSGYPGGLGGAELSDAVRMVTICDIYAAMTETRPYRVPLSPQDALSLMKSMGEQIDQKLVDAFTKADVCNSIAVKRRDLARCFA